MEPADKKARIMQAAEGLFLSRQYHEISIEDIAKAAGIGKGTIYLYFPDKEELFYQTAVAGFDEMCELLQKPAPGLSSFEEKLSEAMRKIGDFFGRRHSLVRMLNSEWGRACGRGGALQDSWLERRKKMISALAGIIAEGVASGELRKDAPCMALAEYLMAMMRARGERFDALRGPEGSIDVLIDFFVNGVKDKSK